MRVTITFRVPIRLAHKGEWVVSHCDAFNVASQGRTEEEARHNIEEALELFLQTAYEMGTLEEIMKECGFSPAFSGVIEKDEVAPEEEFLDIPLPFIINEMMPERCHA